MGETTPTEARDVPERWDITSSVRQFAGGVVSLRTDSVCMPHDAVANRDVVEHPGAVGVIALDGDDRVLLVQQYRHPAGYLLWEPPAGLRDVDGEDPWATVQRELYEEAGYRAHRWHTLVDAFTSPGMSDERVRIYLARELVEVSEQERCTGVHEEVDMPRCWVHLDRAVDQVLAGQLHNPLAVMGILATHAARLGGFQALRARDAPEHEA